MLGQLPERFGARVHAYVLMANHFHLLLETPEANLSRAMQWLNVSYRLTREPLARLCGGRTGTERRAALREYTEAPLRQGVIESPWQRLVGGFVLGSEAFARRLREQVTGNRQEQLAARRLTDRASWEEVVAAMEKLKGRSWEEFRDQYGDWGRDAALWLGRRVARLSLPELARLAGGAEYNAVAQALTRFGKRLEREPKLRQELTPVQNAL